MTNKEFANIVIPGVKLSANDYIEKYKKRELKEGAMVTRFAPSPTGSMHIGNILSAMCTISLARQSEGISFLRIEDTDQKRLVENGRDAIVNGLKELDLIFDESVSNEGNYGPYIQSERIDIYKAFAIKLIEDDLAYACFATPEELEEIRTNQEKKKMRIGCYGKFAKYRDLSHDEVIKKIEAGEKYIVRLKSPGSFYEKVTLNDLIRGKIEMPENDRDEVIIKGDGLPTYHFAHAVDDHLMGTNVIIRGDEWISSYPIHDQLFKCLGFEVPKYAHLSPINIKDGDTTRKISKRKDPWASVSYYNEVGIPNYVIKLYLATLLNSNFEEWYSNSNTISFEEFKFEFSKMSINGPIFDMEKLINISRTYFSRLSADDIYNDLLVYTEKYDNEFNEIIKIKKETMISLLDIERNTAKPRKDISSYADIKNIFWFMFDEYFNNNTDDYEELINITKEELINYTILLDNNYESQEEWFNDVAEYANGIGFTSNRKEYKANPENFKGTTADFCKILRIIITKKNLSPNLFDIIKTLGKDKLIERIEKYFK